MGFFIVSTQFQVTIAMDCGALNVGLDIAFSNMWEKGGEVTSMKVYVADDETVGVSLVHKFPAFHSNKSSRCGLLDHDTNGLEEHIASACRVKICRVRM
jgi:hypothetical protein